MDSVKQAREVEITSPDEHSEELLVTGLGPNLYRLEESSVFGEARYHDVIETETRTDGTLHFVRVVTPSELKTASWILPKSTIESSAVSALLDKVIAVGGHWERIFGGLLLVHVPPAEHDLIVRELENFMSQP